MLHAYIFDIEALSYSTDLLKMYHKRLLESDAMPGAAVNSKP